MKEPRYRAPLVPIGTPGRGYLGLGSFAAAVVPMFLVELALLILLLLVEPKASGSQVSSLPLTTVNNRTLIALAAAALVFPVLLQPLVRILAMTYDRLPRRRPLRGVPADVRLSRSLDDVTWHKFGFVLSDFAQDLDAVLGRPEGEKLGASGTRIEHQRLRASSYLLSARPLAVTAAILWGRFGYERSSALLECGCWR